VLVSPTYEQTFRELQGLTEAGSLNLHIQLYSDMFAEWGGCVAVAKQVFDLPLLQGLT